MRKEEPSGPGTASDLTASGSSPSSRPPSHPFSISDLSTQFIPSAFSTGASHPLLGRPLLGLTVAFIAGISAQRFSPWVVEKEWILSGLLLLLFYLLWGFLSRFLPSIPSIGSIRPMRVIDFIRFSSPPFRLLCLSPVLFFGLGLLAGRLAAPILPAPSNLEPFFDRPRALFLAEIISPPDFNPDKIRLPLKLHEAYIDGKRLPVNGGALLTINRTRSAPATWLLGDRILVSLTLKRFHNFNNPGGFDFVRHQAEQGLYARARLPDDRFLVKLAPAPESFLFSFPQAVRSRLDRFRQEALFWLQSRLEPDTAAFFAALLLGYQNLLSKPWQEHLYRTGMTHLLSISGFHLGLVYLTTFWLMRRLIRLVFPSLLHRVSDQHMALWPALLAAILYAFVSGFAVSPIWRSILMLVFCFGASCWYRSADSYTVLALSALVILLFDPNTLWQISFQLTFACMFALFSLYPRLQRFELSRNHPFFTERKLLQKLVHPFEEAFWVSLAVNVTVLPLSIYYFYGISLAGFAANIILVPLVGFLVLPAGLLSLVLFALNEQVAFPMLEAGSWFLEFCQAIMAWLSNLSWAFFWVGALPVAGLVLFYTEVGILLSRLGWWKKAGLCAGTAGLALLFTSVGAMRDSAAKGDSQSLEAVIIDVSQGTSVLVRFPGGEAMLVDGGGFLDDTFDVGRSVLAPFLWYTGIRRLDHVVLSHDHPDHRNGLRFILSHFDIGDYWESGITDKARDGASEDTEDAPKPGMIHDTTTGSIRGKKDSRERDAWKHKISPGPEPLSAIASRRGIPVRGLPEIFGEHRIGSCRVHVLNPPPSALRDKNSRNDLNKVSLVLQIDYGETHLILPGDIDQSVERLIFETRPLAGQVLLVSPHHGSARSNSQLLLDRLRPRAVAFPCGYENGFGFPAPEVIERCAARKIPVYRTDLQGAVHAVSDGLKWTITTESDRSINAQKDRGIRTGSSWWRGASH